MKDRVESNGESAAPPCRTTPELLINAYNLLTQIAEEIEAGVLPPDVNQTHEWISRLQQNWGFSLDQARYVSSRCIDMQETGAMNDSEYLRWHQEQRIRMDKDLQEHLERMQSGTSETVPLADIIRELEDQDQVS